VSCAKKIESAIKTSIPELYVLGKPPGPVVAFASKSPKVNVLEVGDAMAKRGWHLNGLMEPAAVHIACTVRIRSYSHGKDMGLIKRPVHRG
jgi:sphinganine-1-phosphate aldolase